MISVECECTSLIEIYNTISISIVHAFWHNCRCILKDLMTPELEAATVSA